MNRTLRNLLFLVAAVAAVALAGRRSTIADETLNVSGKDTMATESPTVEAKFGAADFEYFEKKIRPLLHKRCFECHAQSAKSVRGGLRLDNRPALLTGGDSGPSVVPGQPDESLLIEAIRYGQDSFQMPPKGKLPAAEVAELVGWIKRGAPFPPTANQTLETETIDIDAARDFWSFRPLAAAPLPPVQDASWPRAAVDRFVLAKLDEHGLHPAAEADRRKLIRRLSFDLVGLPPAPSEIVRFVADQSPDAYRRLVERLLASPHYGERWGRFWLDLARYTDTTASWLDSTAQAYLYRDWVIEAFNGDMSYREFVVKQLAADLLPAPDPSDTPALGFLGLSPTYWKELKLPSEIIKVIVADEWEERVDVVSRTFLGLTVACARCHNHKFDPVTTEDYYALAGVFASTRFTEQPIIPASEYDVVKQAKAQTGKLAAEVKKLRGAKPAKGAVKPTAEQTAAKKKKIAELEAEIRRIADATPHYHTPLANAVSDASLYVERAGKDSQSGTKLNYKPAPRDLNVFLRGDPNKLGPVVARRFIRVLSSGEPKPFQHGSGRLELAEAIVGDAQALAARVLVNRVWLAHFGQGLVATPSNFGAQGARPTHPELLDTLAARFVASGWSLKWLHRQIVLSATYRQASTHDQEQHERDPGNRWLWRANRRRLDIESWRDAMLSASGQLKRTLHGGSLPLAAATNQRRTIYGTIHRRDMSNMLQMYDFPDPTAHSPQRINTTTPLQGLFALNSPLVESQAKSLAARLRSERPDDIDAQVQLAYQLLFARDAAANELQLARQFLVSDGSPNKQAHAWELYAHVLLVSNECLFLD